jgi:hypothetical protein
MPAARGLFFAIGQLQNVEIPDNCVRADRNIVKIRA